ncbi:MAG: hypothetical protein JOZ72_12890 [Alphaproteobacteria bacterium]|nr:hypothetical protein [Alphaproteobacteria bacterium]
MPAPDLEHVQMSAAERARLDGELRAARAYFELGMGGSSLMAVRAGIAEMVSIDSDASWVEAVRAHPEIAPRLADGSIALLHADIGPVADWGRPADRSALRKWSAYLSTGWAEWARRGAMPDLVFVDGRFRVACCLSVAVACAHLPTEKAPRVLLHDVDDKRAYYRDALELLEQVDVVETLLVMRPRRDVSAALALSRLLERQFDFT